MDTEVRDVSTHWLAAAGWSLVIVGMLCVPQARFAGILLMLVGLLVWAPATHRARWRRATTDADARIKVNGQVTDLTNAASLEVTYRETGASLVIRSRDGRSRKLDWRDPAALDELLAARPVVPHVARFELRRASQAPWIALALAAGAGWIFLLVVWLPSAEPMLLRLPWLMLLGAAALAASLLPLYWLQAAVTIDGPRLWLRPGWKPRTVSFDAVQAVAITDRGVAIKVRGQPTLEIATPSLNTAKRLVRAVGGVSASYRQNAHHGPVLMERE